MARIKGLLEFAGKAFRRIPRFEALVLGPGLQMQQTPKDMEVHRVHRIGFSKLHPEGLDLFKLRASFLERRRLYKTLARQRSEVINDPVFASRMARYMATDRSRHIA